MFSLYRILAGCFVFFAALGAAAESPRGSVVSIGGDVTEIVYALGQQHRLVGVDTSSIYPETAGKLPQVGYMRSLSAEGIIALRPDIVLASERSGPKAVISRLDRVGLRLVPVTAAPSLDDIVEKIRQVAGALQVPDTGEKLAAEFERRLERAVADHRRGSGSGTSRPKVLFILSHAGGSPMVAGANCAAHEMILLANGRNAFSEFSGFKPMTAEAVIKADPDIILMTTQGVAGLGGRENVLQLPGLALTRAGRDGNIIAMDALMLMGFGLRTPQVIETLRVAFDLTGPVAVNKPSP